MREIETTRRSFVQRSAALAAAVVAQATLPNAHAAGCDTIRVGLVGCGGRGTGAAEQALVADPGAKLVALADAFPDRIEGSLSALRSSEAMDRNDQPVTDRIDVPEDRRFVGFDAFKDVIDQVDLVLLATPPHFRPLHYAYAVEKGKHAFVEKPIATDAPGVRRFLEAVDQAQAKGLSLVSGFCWRHYLPRQETLQRIQDGAIGKLVAIETVYNTRGVWEPWVSRDQTQSEMEYQLRNWYYYCWLSGDHIVEQAVHGLDTMNWAMNDEPPTRCWGTGGRQVRVDPIYGNIYDHFSIVYEYPTGVRGYHTCRHWRKTDQLVRDLILGSQGTADVTTQRITGDTPWRYRGSKNNMYQTEHDELFASIRSGQPRNDGVTAARSTLLAIMGRMAAYTGSTVSWEMALNSKEDLSPKEYAWGDAPDRPVPCPGLKGDAEDDEKEEEQAARERGPSADPGA